MIEFLDPTAGPVPGQTNLAPRPAELSALTIGLLNNGKYNSDKVLDHITKRLSDTYPGLAFEYYLKPSAYKPAPERLLRDIAARCRLVITGVGD